MALVNLARALSRLVEGVSVALSALGACALMAMMFLVSADVAGRYLFNYSILGTYEITEYLMVVAVFLGLGFAQMKKAHVSVDIVVGRLPEDRRARVDMLAYVPALLVFALVAWAGYTQAMRLWGTHDTSAVLLIPKWPFQMLVCVGTAVYSLAMLTDILSAVAKVAGKGNRAVPPATPEPDRTRGRPEP